MICAVQGNLRSFTSTLETWERARDMGVQPRVGRDCMRQGDIGRWCSLSHRWTRDTAWTNSTTSVRTPSPAEQLCRAFHGSQNHGYGLPGIPGEAEYHDLMLTDDLPHLEKGDHSLQRVSSVGAALPEGEGPCSLRTSFIREGLAEWVQQMHFRTEPTHSPQDNRVSHPPRKGLGR